MFSGYNWKSMPLKWTYEPFSGWKDGDWAVRVLGPIPPDSEDTELANKE